VRKPAGQKPGSETKLGPGLCRCRRKVRATICRDRLLLSSFNLPHAYFYGNWRAKVPNILQDVRIYRQSRGDPAVLAGRRGPRPSTGIGSEVPINVRKRFGYFCHEGGAATSRGAQGAKFACLSKLQRRLAPLFDFGEECVETHASGVFIFSQPGLEQTQKTKSVVHT